jgi:hypothetical protein
VAMDQRGAEVAGVGNGGGGEECRSWGWTGLFIARREGDEHEEPGDLV